MGGKLETPATVHPAGASLHIESDTVRALVLVSTFTRLIC